jgi:hypothetical protein
MAEQVVNAETDARTRTRRFDAFSRQAEPLPMLAAETAGSQLDRWLGRLAVAALLLAVGHYAFTQGASRATVADFYPLNGDFQNYNPVKRMFLGQRPGQDFDSYLGLGAVWLLYIAMLPLGGDFTSSLLAMEFLHSIASAAAVALLLRLCRLSWGWCWLLGWVVMAYARGGTQVAEILHFVHMSLHELAHASTSALGLRSMPSLLAAPAMCWVLRRFGHDGADLSRAGIGLGMIGGLLLPWSNDHGIATAMAMTLVGGGWLYRRAGTRLAATQAVATMGLAMVLSILLVAVMGHGGNASRWFTYNFLNVSRDQCWYFIGQKVTSISDVPVYHGVWLAVWCLGALVWKIRRAERAEDVALMLVVLANLLAGYVSISGAASPRYFFALNRCLIVVVPYLAYSIVNSLLDSWPHAAARQTLGRYGAKLTAAAAGALLLLSLLASWQSHQQQQANSQIAANLLPVPELGGTLDHRFSKAVALGHEIRTRADAARVSEKHRLFSTYASALDIVAGSLQAGRSDYFIHALGPQRRAAYLEQFIATRPMFVTTIREDFTNWEQWGRCVNWDFYAHLLKHYQPTDRTFYNLLWERRSEPVDTSGAELDTTIAPRDDSSVELTIQYPAAAQGESTERQIVEVEIEYDWQWKPGRLLAGAIRPYLFVRDPARPMKFGLPPYETVRRFPVELAPGETHNLDITCQPVDSTKLTVRRATARVVMAKSAIDDFPLSRLRASSFCDSNWKHGVWVQDQRAAFFVPDGTDLAGLQSGGRLRFASGSERVIERVQGDQVWLEGPPLDPFRDGYPQPIAIVR